MKTYLYTAGIGVLIAATMLGQGVEPRYPIRGEVAPTVSGTGALTIELTAHGGGSSDSAVVKGDGTFELRPQEPGLYDLRVIGPGGQLLHEEEVVLSGTRQSLSVRIPETASTVSRSTGNTISLQQLAHKVPPQARKFYDKGEQAETKGDHQQALEFFRQAVAIDPEYADAQNELGAVQAGQGDFPHAIESFQKALEVAPEHHLAMANLSIVLAKSRRYDEAAGVARRALQLMPTSSTVHYILATSLLIAKGESDEVLLHLEHSKSDIPFAYLLAAEILAHRGKREEAAQHVEDYLKAVPADDKHRSRAEAMLVEMRQ